jgi:hypothetical protein
MSPNSMPSDTIVCAICGLMPEMVHSAPSRRAAMTVFSRRCATSVSTVGTPVMSITACSAPVATSALSIFSMTSCVRAESRVPTSGTPMIPSHSRTTGVDSSSIDSAWSVMIRSLAAVYVSKVCRPRSSTMRVNIRYSGTMPAESATSSYTASLRENTLTAVSVGVAPAWARDRDSSVSAALSSPSADSSVADIARTIRV